MTSNAEIQQSFTLPISYESESNPRYSVSNKTKINRLILHPNYLISLNSETDQLFAGVSYRYEKTSDPLISQDREDPSLDFGWKHDYETGMFSATAKYYEQSTRVSEFTDSGLVEFTNSNLENRDNTRKTYTVLFDWKKNLTERMSIIFNSNVTKVKFDELDTAGLVNFQNESLNTSLNFPLNERIEMLTQLFISRYNPEGEVNTSSETIGYNLGFRWKASENFNIDASAGTNETLSNNVAKSKYKSWQASLSLNYSTLKTNSHFIATRGNIPSSTGTLNEQNRVAANWIYNLSDEDNIALEYIWAQNLSLNKIQINSFTAKYTNKISLSLDYSISVSHKNREDNITKSDSNSVMASIIYNYSEM